MLNTVLAEVRPSDDPTFFHVREGAGNCFRRRPMKEVIDAKFLSSPSQDVFLPHSEQGHGGTIEKTNPSVRRERENHRSRLGHDLTEQIRGFYGPQVFVLERGCQSIDVDCQVTKCIALYCP